MTEPHPSNVEGLRKKFENFDDQEVYDRVQKAAQDPNAQNFVVLFGPEQAKIALDLEPNDFEDLLKHEEPGCPVRWINFWNTSKQKDTIKIIGNKYGFSRRLRASITYWDDLRNFIKHEAVAAAEAKRKKQEQLKPDKTRDDSQSEKTRDLEEGLSVVPTTPVQVQAPVGPAAAAALPKPSKETLENFKVLQDSLNYTTTDHGTHFFCFGANWLHKSPAGGHNPDGLVPPHHWAWYALCADDEFTNTVISVHEAPNYTTAGKGKGISDAQWRATELKNIRTNTVAVLEQLSTIGISEYTDLFLLKAIREPHKNDSSKRSLTLIPQDKTTDVAASNLFYYLFEDYSAVAPVLNTSGRMLKDLSDRVLGRTRKGKKGENHPDSTSTVIQELHELGKGLRQLHHLFESYKNLFETIRKSPPLETAETRMVKLEGQARDRFKRLIDRLQLLMLNTIREYIEEKKELSDTYFNLTAQKDSQATARLTRSATLLAKLSVFFLPISFITSYFSVQIPELNNAYTAKTYWYTFAVVAAISFVSLFFFSKLLMFVSDRLDQIADVISRRVGGMVRRGKDHVKKE